MEFIGFLFRGFDLMVYPFDLPAREADDGAIQVI